MAFDDFLNKLANQAGVKAPGVGNVTVPGGDYNPPDDRKTVPIIGENWNQPFPYAFSINLAGEDGRTTGEIAPFDAVTGYQFNYNYVQLPLPPSAISVGLMFTGTVSATNKGILEENNGVVFRNIMIQGTTGITPNKGQFEKQGSIFPSVLGGIFPKAESALSGLAKTVKSVFATASDKKVEDLSEEALKQTGYYQFWMLHNFFVEYAEAKKRNDGSKIRLVFHSIKDNIGYVVTPTSFDLRRDTSNPNLYRYSIGLRCWDIVTSAKAPVIDNLIVDRDNKFKVKDLLDRIRTARRAVQQASNTIKAVQSDVGDALQVINQGVLVLKDVVSLESDVMDFLPTIINNLDGMIKSNKQQFAQVVMESGGNLGPLGKFFLEGERNLGQLLGSTVALASGGLINPANPDASALSGLADVGQTLGLDGGLTASKNLSPSGEKASAEGTDAASLQAVSKTLSNPDVAENIKLSDLAPIPASVVQQIQVQQEKAQQLTSTDIYNLADKMKEISDNIAYSTGMMDPVYAEIYGLPAPTETFRTPTEDEILLAAQIEDGRDAFLATVASGTIYNERELDPFNEANKMLPDAEKLQTPSSALPIIVDRGVTLEQIAQQYLGDSTRAKEIAILNKLRAPYIDENGFQLGLIGASGRTFIVSDSKSLTMGQQITIKGSGKPGTRRKILNIEDLGSGSFRITVDGSANLHLYDAGSSPYLQARLPGTIGTGDTLLIPSAGAAETKTRSTPFIDQLSYAERVFKVDIASSPEGDIILGPGGDLQLVYGYQNAVQALLLMMETEKGELELHQEYGLDIAIGDTINGDILSEVENNVRTMVTSDPRFASAIVSAAFEGTVLKIRIDATGANGSGRIPVEFQTNT